MVAASPRLDVNNPFLQKIISEQRLKSWEFEQEQQREMIEKSLKDISKSAIACKRYTRKVIEDHSRLLTEIENVHKELNKLAEFDKKTHKLSDADKATWLTAATIMKASHSFADSHKEQRDTFVTSIIEMQRLVLKILNFGVKHFACSRLIADKNQCSFRDDHNCKLDQKKCRKTCLCSDCDSPLPDISSFIINRASLCESSSNPLNKNASGPMTESRELKEMKDRVYEQSQISRGVLTDLQISSQKANEMLQTRIVQRTVDELSNYSNEDLENDEQACNRRKRRKTSFSNEHDDLVNCSRREKGLSIPENNRKFSTEALFPHLVSERAHDSSSSENHVASRECTSTDSPDFPKVSSTSNDMAPCSYLYIKAEPEDDLGEGDLKPELDSERGSIDMEIDSESQNTTSDEAIISDVRDETPNDVNSCRDEFIRRQLNAPNITKEEAIYPTSTYQISHYDKMISSPKVTLNITSLSGDENASDQNVSNIIGKRLVCSQSVPEANVESVLHAALKRPLATPKPEPPKVVTPTLPGVSSSPFMGSSMIPPPFPNPHMFMYMPGPPPPFPFPPWPYPLPPPKNGPEAYHVPPPPMMPQWMSNFYVRK